MIFFLFMVIVAKSVIQIVDSVGLFLSALGLHNYNRLLAGLVLHNGNCIDPIACPGQCIYNLEDFLK